MDGAGPRDGLQGANLYAGQDRISIGSLPVHLGGTYPFLVNRRAVSTDDQFLGSGREFGQATDGKVFVVETGVIVDSVIGLAKETVRTARGSEEEVKVEREDQGTFLTTGKIQGFALLSRYAPMPRSTFLSEGSSR